MMDYLPDSLKTEVTTALGHLYDKRGVSAQYVPRDDNDGYEKTVTVIVTSNPSGIEAEEMEGADDPGKTIFIRVRVSEITELWAGETFRFGNALQDHYETHRPVLHTSGLEWVCFASER